MFCFRTWGIWFVGLVGKPQTNCQRENKEEELQSFRVTPHPWKGHLFKYGAEFPALDKNSEYSNIKAATNHVDNHWMIDFEKFHNAKGTSSSGRRRRWWPLICSCTCSCGSILHMIRIYLQRSRKKRVSKVSKYFGCGLKCSLRFCYSTCFCAAAGRWYPLTHSQGMRRQYPKTAKVVIQQGDLLLGQEHPVVMFGLFQVPRFTVKDKGRDFADDGLSHRWLPSQHVLECRELFQAYHWATTRSVCRYWVGFHLHQRLITIDCSFNYLLGLMRA